MKLLIVDDERRIREIIAKQISRNSRVDGIFQAGNGEEALEVIRTHRVDAVITDIAMPVMDGLDFIRNLRESGESIPVVIMSGYDEFSYAQTALRYNAIDYILKPVSPDTLESIIEDLDKRIRLSSMNDRNRKGLFLSSLIDGTAGSAAEVYRKMASYGMPHSISLCITGFIHALRRDGNPIPCDSFTITDYLEETEEDGMSVHPFRHGRMNAFLFLFGNAIERIAAGKAAEFIHRLNADLLASHGIRLFFALGSPVPSVLQLRKASEEAMAAYRAETGFMTDIRIYRAVNGDHLALLGEAEERIDAFTKGLAEGVMDKDQLDSAFSSMSESVRTGNGDWNYPLLYMIRKLEQVIATLPGEDQRNIGQALSSAKTADSLMQGKLLLRDAALSISASFSRQRESSTRSMIEEIKRSIRKNIANESFTVRDAIKGISYSENYIRYIFSNSEGMSIKDYMIKARMEEAFLLLREGKPIKEVAERTGYSNQRYFARFFKEYTGMTPSEWKADQK